MKIQLISPQTEDGAGKLNLRSSAKSNIQYDKKGVHSMDTPTDKPEQTVIDNRDIRLIETKEINQALVDGYYGLENAWFTRTQIGEALEYNDPNRQIARIHNRHNERLDQFSVVVKLTTTDGKAYDTYLYNFKGVLEICRWSRQPKADMVMNALYDMATEVMEKGYYSVLPDDKLITLLSQRLKDNPNLMRDVTISKRNDEWYQKFSMDEELRKLWDKRLELSTDDYNTELVTICNHSLSRYNEEWRKYVRWRRLYNQAQAESRALK